MATEIIRNLSVKGLLPFNARMSGPSFSKWLLSATLLLPACGPSDAAPSNTTQARVGDREKKPYAVAGIAPGMTASAVVAAAQRAGYRLTNEDAGTDWRQEMEKATSGKFDLYAPQKGIGDHEFHKGGEMVLVDYVAMPQGPVAWSVHYSAPPAVLDFGTANGELTRRYGRSSFGNSKAAPWAQWCSKSAPTQQDCNKSSYIMLTSDNRSSVSMHTADEGIRQEQKRLLLKLSGAKPTF